MCPPRSTRPSRPKSPHHCVRQLSATSFVIEDVGSKNGTPIGDEAVTAARELRHGDKIKFGRNDAIYCASESGIPTVTEGDWSHN